MFISKHKDINQIKQNQIEDINTNLTASLSMQVRLVFLYSIFSQAFINKSNLMFFWTTWLYLKFKLFMILLLDDLTWVWWFATWLDVKNFQAIWPLDFLESEITNLVKIPTTE